MFVDQLKWTCLALRWSDVDWCKGELSIRRGIVRNRIDEVKTVNSDRKMSLDAAMLGILKTVEGNVPVPSRWGLDLCLPGAAWRIAVVWWCSE